MSMPDEDDVVKVQIQIQILPEQPVEIELEQLVGKGGGVPLRQRRRWFRSSRDTTH